jgi:hypothetical protein
MLCLLSLMDLTIAHMVFAHERTNLCIDALVMTHVLIVVIVSSTCMIFLLCSPTLILSPNNWWVHIFLIVVHVPLVQRVRCKRLLRLLQVA